MDITVTDAPSESRFEGLLDTGELAGFLTYREVGDIYFLNHTEVQPEYGGQGVGSRIIRGTLDMVRFQNKQIIARCPFVVAFLEKHPENRDLVSNRM